LWGLCSLTPSGVVPLNPNGGLVLRCHNTSPTKPLFQSSFFRCTCINKFPLIILHPTVPRSECASCRQQGLQAVKLCSNKIIWFSTGVPANTGCPVWTHRQIDRGRFHSFFSTITLVSRYQNAYINLDFNEAINDVDVVASAGPYANYLQLAPDR